MDALITSCCDGPCGAVMLALLPSWFTQAPTTTHIRPTAERLLSHIFSFREQSHVQIAAVEFRNAFLKTIRQIIRDSVRRMNLPPVNPSPNEATSSSTAQLNYNQNRNTGNNNGMIKRDVEMCSETDSTNECSDFKSELDDDLEDPTQRKTSGSPVWKPREL